MCVCAWVSVGVDVLYQIEFILESTRLCHVYLFMTT